MWLPTACGCLGPILKTPTDSQYVLQLKFFCDFIGRLIGRRDMMAFLSMIVRHFFISLSVSLTLALALDVSLLLLLGKLPYLHYHVPLFGGICGIGNYLINA